MKINGNEIFMGAYAERHLDKFQFNQKALSLSEEKEKAITTGIKEAFNFLNLQNQGVSVSISKEDMDFLCSEEGFEKIKKDAEDLYIKNASQQKVITKDKNPEDLFWNNTGNQWLVFSEFLYNDGFYTNMSDAEVKEFEDTLAYITSGMDRLSRSQYMTGIDFSAFEEEFNYFMTQGEAITALESSTAALRYLSDKMVPTEQRGEFNKLIDMYYAHNTEVISEYNNPMESFNKVIAGIHSKKLPYSSLSEEMADKPVSEYQYTIALGKIDKLEAEKKQYQDEVAALFEMLKESAKSSEVWNKIKDKFLDYSTGDSDNSGFREYVLSKSNYLFAHMEKCWGKLLRLG